MGNSYFKFKQFTVHQDRCAQKVCTDACLFGALIDPKKSRNILDIGTGTGVLALMLAQKSEAQITAVELDEDAAQQARENVDVSPWKERITVIHNDIIHFAAKRDRTFDLIMCNPPFFQNSTKSGKENRDRARHNDSLSLFDLAKVVANLLAEGGHFWVLLPEQEFTVMQEELLKRNLFAKEIIGIRNDPETTTFVRKAGCFSFENTGSTTREINIYQNKERSYSPEFEEWLRPYYLYL